MSPVQTLSSKVSALLQLSLWGFRHFMHLWQNFAAIQLWSNFSYCSILLKTNKKHYQLKLITDSTQEESHRLPNSWSQFQLCLLRVLQDHLFWLHQTNTDQHTSNSFYANNFALGAKEGEKEVMHCQPASPNKPGPADLKSKKLIREFHSLPAAFFSPLPTPTAHPKFHRLPHHMLAFRGRTVGLKGANLQVEIS